MNVYRRWAQIEQLLNGSCGVGRWCVSKAMKNGSVTTMVSQQGH